MDKNLHLGIFNAQLWNAHRRGIPFKLTFDEWWQIWQDSGHYADRGRGRGKYVMSRINDAGAYEVDNVFIQLFTQNVSDGWRNGPRSNRHGRPGGKGGGKQKPCTVDGATIYPSRKALIAALGHGINGWKHPHFRFI